MVRRAQEGTPRATTSRRLDQALGTGPLSARSEARGLVERYTQQATKP